MLMSVGWRVLIVLTLAVTMVLGTALPVRALGPVSSGVSSAGVVPAAAVAGQGGQPASRRSVSPKRRVNVQSLQPARSGKPQQAPPHRQRQPGPPSRTGVASIKAANGAGAQASRGPVAPQIASGSTAQSAAGSTSSFADPGIEQLTEFDAAGFDNFAPPDTQMAAGPDFLVEMDNVNGYIYEKSSKQDLVFGLGAFFGTNATFPAFSDPKVLYDAESRRFFASGLLFDNCNPAPPPTGSGCTTAGNSQVDIAVSDDSNPFGTWFVYVVDSNTSGTLFDQPKIGVDSDKITVSWNNNNGDGGP